MTLARRSFLKLFGSGIGLISSKSLSRALESGPDVRQLSRKILVAHRGASAYAPEHTLESYQLALKQGADFVEQDLQITRDGVLVCLHDLTLERTTNVKQIFSTRFREELVNGTPARRWYVSDFSLREIKRLDAGSWFDVKSEVYGQSGFDMERLVLDVLGKNRLDKRSAAGHTPVIIQSFSPESLRKLSRTLKTKLPLVLLVSDEAPTSWLTAVGLAKAKQFASGIGPAKALVDKSLVTQAHALGLSVTPYTFRASNAGRFKTVREEMSYYLYTLGVDALFTDNPDLFPRAPS